MKQNKIIGLTGGIASGKSTASSYISKKGFNIIDADKIAREIVKRGSKALYLIEKEFGKSVINEDGKLNRKKLRSIVFNDKEKLNKLNNITHPIIINEIKRKIDGYKIRNEIAFLDCPLLFELGLEDLTDEVWLISTNENNQIKRIIKRDNSTEKEAKNIIHSQMSLKSKESKSDYIIYNNGSLDELLKKIDNMIKTRC